MDKKHTRSLSGGRGSVSSEELTIASPPEFVQHFGGKRVIEKASKYSLLFLRDYNVLIDMFLIADKQIPKQECFLPSVETWFVYVIFSRC